VRLVHDGAVLDPAAWTTTARTGSMRIDDLVDAGRVLDLFASGSTIVLQSMHRWWPPLTGFCRELELALGHHVQVNAYLTPAGAAGLSPHHDTHDVFVMQVTGSKRWVVREPAVDAPLGRHRSDHARAAEQPIVAQIELGPGDCLYLPRGYIHSATAQEAVSLHLTVGVLASTAHDVLRRLVDRAAEVPAFRRTLPPGLGSEVGVGERVVKELLAELAEWLGTVDEHDLADELRARFWTRRRPLLAGQLLELTTLDDLTDHSVVQRRSDITCLLTTGPEELEVVLGDRRLHLPAAVAAAVQCLVDGEPHTVAELADRLDGPSRLVLVRRLVREGILVRLEAGSGDGP